MRLLVILLTILLFLNILGFVLTNLDTRVAVTVWKTEHRDVPLFYVVILSVLAGIVYAGVIAMAEGARLRFANRRLLRDLQKLETEVNYLRTQPATRAGREVAAPPDARSAGGGPKGSEERETAAPASAPVYGTPDEDFGNEPDEDAYSGGRAV